MGTDLVLYTSIAVAVLVVLFFMWMIPALRWGAPIAYAAFFLSGVVHELGHGLGSLLTGGTAGFQSSAGDIYAGYSLNGIYAGIMPVFSIHMEVVGDYGWMLLAGPWASILLGVLAARLFSYTRLRETRWQPAWPLLKWVVVGLLLRAVADAIYLLPIDVFPSDIAHANGDGMALYNHWQDLGLDWSTNVIALNFEYIVGAAALALVAYHVWYFIMTSKVTQ